MDQLLIEWTFKPHQLGEALAVVPSRSSSAALASEAAK